jgi:hypothetical protein
MGQQLGLSGIEQLCETGDISHPPRPIAVGEYLVGDHFLWLCYACFKVLWPHQEPKEGE